ncbi:MAG TPA: rhodanese-related sulfurtransferase [Bacteroidia bacterium]|nr:rhodanese-related sulfurtransferase [Bacteroidia bacterium]MBP7713534.1 rhodanese-related sulfurtransferase [Bacteroidia bacterium]MBP8667376.1 rhodanese-related sulfurtransferase [Bacteroidia bacterium]HOZ82886.1 rhodanese-related sulfurtransferase [Bacteroidia bacterium]HOZ89714.1 rhodanese-related sulfurtransferase [Bacteroidia bacterium]
MQLRNLVSKQLLKKRLTEETFNRKTVSFYRYLKIEDVENFRNRLYIDFEALNIFGRVYVAAEGINAQISVPEQNWELFKNYLEAQEQLKNMPLKIAVEDNGKSFYKLIVRIKSKIVADGLNDNTFDVTNVGNHLSAKEFNEAMQQSGTIVIDMRNHYESEVGFFKDALKPDADTFRDALPQAIEMTKDNKDNKILLYCTGGIRCEKASAYFKHHGYKDVNQLYGGIIQYAREVNAEHLENKFLGKNFVFDERMGERISDEIVSTCHQCGGKCDTHVNCANDDCHLLFIQCESCKATYEGCCTPECKAIINLPEEEQKRLRKGRVKKQAHAVYKSRLRPDLKKILK